MEIFPVLLQGMNRRYHFTRQMCKTRTELTDTWSSPCRLFEEPLVSGPTSQQDKSNNYQWLFLLTCLGQCVTENKNYGPCRYIGTWVILITTTFPFFRDSNQRVSFLPINWELLIEFVRFFGGKWSNRYDQVYKCYSSSVEPKVTCRGSHN